MLLYVLVEWGVTILVKQVQYFFLSQGFLFLVEYVEVVLFKVLVHLLHLQQAKLNSQINLPGHRGEPSGA